MKKFTLTIILAVYCACIMAQPGQTCATAININPSNSPSFTAHTSNTKEMWFKFTAGAPNVNVALKTNQFGLNSTHVHEMTLYSGSCGNLNPIATDELPFVNYAEKLAIDLNATGLIPGQNYFIKIDREAHSKTCDKANCTANNSANSSTFDLSVENINVLIPLDFNLEQAPAALSYETNRGQLIDVNIMPFRKLKCIMKS